MVLAMKKTAGISGIILAVVFLVLGFLSSTPDKYIKSYGTGKMYEYVGGDAYNYIIEASLRGGEISGAKTAKAVYFSAAGILFVLSLSFLAADAGKDEIRNDTGNVTEDVPASDPEQQEEDDLPENIQDNEAEDVPASDPEQQEENDPQENSQDSETDRE